MSYRGATSANPYSRPAGARQGGGDANQWSKPGGGGSSSSSSSSFSSFSSSSNAGGLYGSRPNQSLDSQPHRPAASSSSSSSSAAAASSAPTQSFPGVFNPADMDKASATFQNFTSDPMKKAMISAGMQAGSSFLGRYVPGIAILWDTLRRYFHVDNAYVKTKLLRIVFPFRHRNWERLEVGGGDGDSAVMAPPTKDTNAPDLYIPSMSLMTFVLIVSFVKGTAMKFTPDVMYEVGTYCVFTNVMEILVVKLSLYLLGHARASSVLGVFDVLAFVGYKYVGLCINMLVAMLFGWWVYYPTLLYTGLGMGYFMVRTFKAAAVRDRNPKTTILLAIVAVMQLLVMWWLAYTGDIAHGTGAVALPGKAEGLGLSGSEGAGAAVAGGPGK
jgi:hypothetical protein